MKYKFGKETVGNLLLASVGWKDWDVGGETGRERTRGTVANMCPMISSTLMDWQMCVRHRAVTAARPALFSEHVGEATR